MGSLATSAKNVSGKILMVDEAQTGYHALSHSLTHMHTRIHAHTHKNTRTCIHAHTHMHTHTHTQEHTHSLPPSLNRREENDNSSLVDSSNSTQKNVNRKKYRHVFFSVENLAEVKSSNLVTNRP